MATRRRVGRPRKRRTVKRNSWYGQPRRHSKAAKKGWRRRRRTYRRRRNPYPMMIAGANPSRRRRRRSYRRNAPRRRSYRRSYRRNPAISLGGPLDFRKNMPYIFTGALSATAVTMVPGFVKPMLGPAFAGPGAGILLKLGTAIGGSFIIDMMVPRKGYGATFALVGSGIAIAEALKLYILGPMGLSDYEVSDYEISENEFPAELEDYSEEGVEAFPDVAAGVGAFPSTVETF